MKYGVGDVIILRTCPIDNNCYFIGTIVPWRASEFALSSIPRSRRQQPGEHLMEILEWHCQENHNCSKAVRYLHADIDLDRITLWI